MSFVDESRKFKLRRSNPARLILSRTARVYTRPAGDLIRAHLYGAQLVGSGLIVSIWNLKPVSTGYYHA